MYLNLVCLNISGSGYLDGHTATSKPFKLQKKVILFSKSYIYPVQMLFLFIEKRIRKKLEFKEVKKNKLTLTWTGRETRYHYCEWNYPAYY